MQSGMQVSHEAIYTAIYALPRGELRRELISFCGRTNRAVAASRNPANAAESCAT